MGLLGDRRFTGGSERSSQELWSERDAGLSALRSRAVSRPFVGELHGAQRATETAMSFSELIFFSAVC